MYDLIVIGGGPAGLAAVCYARTQHRHALLIGDVVGGKVDWLEQHMAAEQPPVFGTELVRPLINRMSREIDRILRDRAQEISVRPHSFDVMTSENGTLRTRALLVATGARAVPLAVPGASRLVNHGLHYSLVSHAALAEGQSVAVVGTTARILRDTVSLARRAEQIFIITPGPLTTPTAIIRQLRQRHNIELIEGGTVVEVLGQEAVRELVVDYQGQRRHLEVAAVFADVGLRPNSEIVSQLVATDPCGFIIIDQHGLTSLPGLFAAGDVTTVRAELIATAIGDGARAAKEANDYLAGCDETR